MEPALSESDAGDPPPFERIAADLAVRGWSVVEQALPAALATALEQEVRGARGGDFQPATIGRQQDRTLNGAVRRDAIRWIDGDTAAQRDWLAWTTRLQTHLNRRLFLGLFSYESHFAHYPPGAFYRRHVDAFRGDANRVLSTVLYLNRSWRAQDGGELLLYPEAGDQPLLRLTPALGTLALFLSEAFPHEVLPAARDRYSIAGWFRVNTSTASRVDPPR
ncbi:MAG: 2OG-Fe(II) oxygenase [Rhodocyclaceae bacterium]|nr:2OG-Fe(II) oxygenase [Rhodocyclaceae bacterium]